MMSFKMNLIKTLNSPQLEQILTLNMTLIQITIYQDQMGYTQMKSLKQALTQLQGWIQNLLRVQQTLARYQKFYATDPLITSISSYTTFTTPIPFLLSAQKPKGSPELGAVGASQEPVSHHRGFFKKKSDDELADIVKLSKLSNTKIDSRLTVNDKMSATISNNFCSIQPP